MKHYGDVSAINGFSISPVDIITFGSPCQDLSIAGKREGIKGARSGLFYQAVRIIKEMREATNGKYPRYIVWENVPGAFSSNKGEDFGCVLDEICSIGSTEDIHIARPKKWNHAGYIMGKDYSVAWRTFDALGFGVPQRRKRIYLVGDLDGGSAGKILFESEGMSGYSESGFKAWKEASRCPEIRIGESDSSMCVNDDVQSDMKLFDNHRADCRYRGPLPHAPSVCAYYGTGGVNTPLVAEPYTMRIRCGKPGGGKGALIQKGISGTLGCNNDQTLFQPKAFGICADQSHSMLSENPESGFYEADSSRTIDTSGMNPSCNQGGIAVVDMGGGKSSCNVTEDLSLGSGVNEDVSFTLNATDRHAVAYNEDELPCYSASKGDYQARVVKNHTSALTAWDCIDPPTVYYPCYSTSHASYHTSCPKDFTTTIAATDYKDPPTVTEGKSPYIVRRLTPVECCRLQGFPDWWCCNLGTDDPTEEEMIFWRDVFETHRKIVTHASKPKTDNQIRKWLKQPYSDSAAYKMWGNGVALPCVWFVSSGIVWADSQC